MSLASLERTLPANDPILTDSSTLLAHFYGDELVTPAATHVMKVLVESGRNPAVVSVVSAVEILIRPLRAGAGEAYHNAMEFLSRFPNVTIAVADLFVAQEAASLRATYNFSTPDALIIATGLVYQVGHLVTNDKSWQTKLRPISQRISVCYLGDHLPL